MFPPDHRERECNAELASGPAKITRIVEMDLSVPAEFMAGATPAELRKLPRLYPHFVSEDDSTLNPSVHALLVDAPGLRRSSTPASA